MQGFPVEVDTVDEVKAHIQELARQKVDMVKIWVDDHWGHYAKIRPELYKAIIEEAHKNNLRVMAHLFYLGDAKGLVGAGLDGMAHSVRDREVDDALIKTLKEKNSFAVATLTREESTFIYAEPPAFLDDPFFSRWADPEVIKALKDPAWGKKVKADPDFSKYAGQLKMGQKNLKKLFDAGVKVAFGTDTGPPARFQGFFEHRELELMVQAGLTAAQALKTATLNAAECLRAEKDIGTLEKGKRADLIVLDADPLENILNTRKINQVWIGGREVELNMNHRGDAEAQRINAITEKIIGCAIEVHRALGPGLLESSYEECTCYEIRSSGLKFERQVSLPVVYKGVKLDCGYRMDLVVEKVIVVEFKTVEALLPVHEAQLLSYLKLSGLSVGLCNQLSCTSSQRRTETIVNAF